MGRHFTRPPVHFPATDNTVARGGHQYLTNLDIACDLAALKSGELDQEETVTLVEYLTRCLHEGRVDATAQQ